jgi:DNA-binding XRE family transcriptional regulator
VPQLARREPTVEQVLEGRQLGRWGSGPAGAGGPLVGTGELDPPKQVAQARLSYWLCTHWLTWPRMPGVTPEEQFAANLRRHRAAARLSQEQLAERSGLHPTEISRLERAVREPRLGTIARLAKGLGVGAEQLVAGIR